MKRFELPRVSFNNPAIPGASEKMAIHWSPEMGRHLVAVEDIKPGTLYLFSGWEIFYSILDILFLNLITGEILAFEKSYASILLPSYHHTHCSYCYQRTEAPIPCDECSSVSAVHRFDLFTFQISHSTLIDVSNSFL